MEMILIPKSSWVLSQTTNALLCTGLFCVYRLICLPSSVRGLQAPTVFIPFTTRCILNAQFVGLTGFYSVYRRICFPNGTSCHSFAFRQSSREFTLVRLYMNVKQVEDSENKYGVFIGFCLLPPTGLVGFCLKLTLLHHTIFRVHTTA